MRCTRDRREQHVVRGGLRQVLQRAQVHGLDRRLHRGHPRHQDHGHVEIPGADRPQQLDPRHPRHLDVADDDVERVLRDGFDRPLASVHDGDRVPHHLEEAPQGTRDGRVVVDDQDGLLLRRWTVGVPAGACHHPHSLERGFRTGTS
jgi:hypothetical protein